MAKMKKRSGPVTGVTNRSTQSRTAGSETFVAE